MSGDEVVFAVGDPAVFSPITIDETLCIGCNLCVFVCQADLFLPSAEKGGPPLVMYGGECWYEGSCVDHCPVPGAITLNSLIFNRVRWEESVPNDTARAVESSPLPGPRAHDGPSSGTHGSLSLDPARDNPMPSRGCSAWDV